MLTVLGLGLAASSLTSYGQGHIAIGNYQGAYNTVVWGTGPRNGLPVLSTEGITLTIWFGEGAGLTADQLTQGPVASWRVSSENAGFPGYYNFTTVLLPTWNAGDTFTFQVRASGGNFTGASSLWTEQAQITSSVGDPAPLPQLSQQSIGLTVVLVPEPSTFALAGLGSAALLIFRRRNS